MSGKADGREINGRKIGLISLSALVFSSMVGAGIFSLPQNMAAVSGAQALIIGWIITGVGIIFLGLSFFMLARLRPDLTGGIYTYARTGFGNLIGFLSAWGYWLCATIGVVSYLVVMFAALSMFTDTPDANGTVRIIFGNGNTIYAIIGESIVLWSVHWLVSRGIKEAASINLVATLAKTLPILFFIGVAVFYFQPAVFVADFKGASLDVSLWDQVRNTMLITLWVFTGIEGASVLSARAKNMRAVGYATLIGVVLALVIYMAITLLAFGLIPREQIAGLTNPSMAGLLSMMIGPFGKVLIVLCLIVSVSASYLSWVLFSAEVPHIGAKHGAFPKILTRVNKNGTPIASLWLTSATVQFCLILVLFTEQTYETLLMIASVMVLLPYLFVGLFLCKVSFFNDVNIAVGEKNKSLIWAKIIGTCASIYGIWLVYAAGTELLLMSIYLYIPGLFIYAYSRYKYKSKYKK
ncbi:arginine/ornithine antiporter transporter [Gammaproteobacteria bacterium]|nr:arginine/ornithine antiporter transporter [Gammaproteobacteria bacterium]